MHDQVTALNRLIGDRPVTVVAVTKYARLDRMEAAYEAGIRDFGENKVQDALAKMPHFPAERFADLRWHFIGNLQTNKVNKTPGRFSLIHSVDNLKLAEKLSAANQAAGLIQPVLLQVNFSPDESRQGFLPARLEEAAVKTHELAGLSVRGLMTMAPHTQDSAVIKGVFSGLRDMRDDLERKLGIRLPELSMGMSNDFVHALECGATIIRVGSYFFRD